MENKFIKLPLFLGVVSVIAAIILGLTYEITKDAISKEELRNLNANYYRAFEKYKETNKTTIGDFVLYEYNATQATSAAEKEIKEVKQSKDGKGKKIYGVVAMGFGWNYEEMLLAFNEKKELVGLVTVTTNDTKGYGKNLETEEAEAYLLLYLETNDDKYLNKIATGATRSRTGALEACLNAIEFAKEL